MKTILLISKILLLSYLIQYEQLDSKYIVNTQKLNVREFANIDSDIIGQLNYGDTIVSKGNFEEWLRIDIEYDDRFEEKTFNDYAYLNIEYVKLVEEHIDDKADISEEESPFTYGFVQGLQYPFVILCLIFAGKDYLKSKRVKDGRYKKGYKEIPFTGLELFKYAFYAFIFSLPIGLISGLFYWLSSL